MQCKMIDHGERRDHGIKKARPSGKPKDNPSTSHQKQRWPYLATKQAPQRLGQNTFHHQSQPPPPPPECSRKQACRIWPTTNGRGWPWTSPTTWCHQTTLRRRKRSGPRSTKTYTSLVWLNNQTQRQQRQQQVHQKTCPTTPCSVVIAK